MVAVASKRADLVEVAHPGFKVIYHKGIDKAGKAVVVPYTMPDIDAHDAVTRFPDQYSFVLPEDAGELQPPVGVHDAFAAAPVTPAPIASQAVGGVDTSVGHGNPSSPPAQAGTASASVPARVAADNEKAVDQAKDGKDTKK